MHMYSNPILNSSLKNSSNSNTISTQTIQQLKNLMQNPQAILQQNPNLQNIISIARNHGLSLQQLAQMIAQQRGYNLNEIIQQLQS